MRIVKHKVSTLHNCQKEKSSTNIDFSQLWNCTNAFCYIFIYALGTIHWELLLCKTTLKWLETHNHCSLAAAWTEAPKGLSPIPLLIHGLTSPGEVKCINSAETKQIYLCWYFISLCHFWRTSESEVLIPWSSSLTFVLLLVPVSVHLGALVCLPQHDPTFVSALPTADLKKK